MHLSSSSPDGGGCGPYFGGMVSRKQRAAQASYWLVLKDQQPKVETLSQASYPALMSVLLTPQVKIGSRYDNQ
jgi:hypothetical protein